MLQALNNAIIQMGSGDKYKFWLKTWRHQARGYMSKLFSCIISSFLIQNEGDRIDVARWWVIHFLVMILRYSRAFCAAEAWASLLEGPAPWHTATGNVESWTRHWHMPVMDLSSMSTYVTSNDCSEAISCKNWTKLKSLLFSGVD